MRFDAADLKAGATIHAKELAFLAAPYAVDNLEGLAATKGARDFASARTLVALRYDIVARNGFADAARSGLQSAGLAGAA